MLFTVGVGPLDNTKKREKRDAALDESCCKTHDFFRLRAVNRPGITSKGGVIMKNFKANKSKGPLAVHRHLLDHFMSN